MNPFALHGFDFLAFYLVTGIAVVVGLRLWIRRSETDDSRGAPNLTDPYLIAQLRAGPNEALRVATVSLVDRGLLDASDDTLSTHGDDAERRVQRPIEKAILRHFRNPGKAWEVFKDAGAQMACNTYEDALARAGLVADGRTLAQRFPAFALALALLVGIAAIKIGIALSEGRHNIGFTILLAIVFSIVALAIWRKRLTGRGVAMLGDLRSLFARLRGRAGSLRKGGQTNEAALLAAVFGIAVLPTLAFGFTRKLYPKAGDGSSCGSSCSSSSSCGSSCGGGGCGGGCGG